MYFSYYIIIKFIEFELIYYAINSNIVSLFKVFNDLIFISIDILVG